MKKLTRKIAAAALTGVLMFTAAAPAYSVQASAVVSAAKKLVGWQTFNGKTYYYKGGKPVTASTNIAGVRYKFDENGVCLGRYTGFTKNDKGKQYYNNGKMVKNSWIKIDGENKYYAGKNGYLLTGIAEVDGKKYEFDKEGALISWQVTVTVRDVSPTGIVILQKLENNIYKNKTSADNSYILEKREGSLWTRIAEYEDKGKHSTLYTGKPAAQTIDWTSTAGALSTGSYRIRKEYGMYDKDGYEGTKAVYVYFDVNNGPEIKDTYVWGVEMYAGAVGSEGVTLYISRSASDRALDVVTSGGFDSLERQSAGSWETLSPANSGTTVYPDVVLSPNTEKPLFCDLSGYGGLSAGTYRITKTFFANGEAKKAYAVFDIK